MQFENENDVTPSVINMSIPCFPVFQEYNKSLPEKGVVMYSSHLLKSDFAWNDCNILAPIGAVFQIVFSQLLAITIADCHPIKTLGFSW